MRTPFYFIASSIALAGFATLAACSSGGGSSGTPSTAQETQFCMSLCAKENTCNPTFLLNCTQQCAPNDAGTVGTALPPNCDGNKFIASGNACLSGTCADLNTCLVQATVAAGCSTTTNTGTGTDTSSTTGTGTDTNTGIGTTLGDGAAPSCSDCVKAQACCIAIDAVNGVGDGGECSAYSAASCNSQTGAAQTETAAACQDSLAILALSGNPACM